MIVSDGSGSRWSVEIFNRLQEAKNNELPEDLKLDAWEVIGDLSAADSGPDSEWTTVAVTTTTDTPTEYLDAEFLILVRVHSESPPQVRLAKGGLRHE